MPLKFRIIDNPVVGYFECKEFLQQSLLFDIEINERNRIYSVGAVFRGEKFQINSGKEISSEQLQSFDDFGSAASFILGHNILRHDIPRLKNFSPSLRLLRKPAIDTLYLSPLAYPENPYHRLVKDYKLVRDSVNDPCEDALLAGRVFSEQWDAFSMQMEGKKNVLSLYRSFLQKDSILAGTADALHAMGIPLLESDELYRSFFRLAEKHCCINGLKILVNQLVAGRLTQPPLAYVTAWLTVAGGNSILPPWVRHRFPEVSVILHQLRENPCGDSQCNYCRKSHNPKLFLRNFFGFDDFRAEPATEEGRSLQEEIVEAGVRNTTLFATLPTGGGKSLCFLLPALMRYQRRNLLTIVISPLQALMKDQVDNFSRQTGTKIAVALYGLLTMPERGEVLEGIRSGDVGILYISPEQLRNFSFVSIISQREVGAWIFDEAHCLSKWGHDFRPDYLYSIRFIREFALKEKTRIPPVQCFTATAKKDVKAEITDIIQSELGLRVTMFEGGHERTNLHYEVWPVEKYEKKQTILELLRARYREGGSVVIYCASRKSTENIAEFLQSSGYTAEAFHAGLEPSLKKRIQDNFIEGTTPVICATNAFGMGIDKDDVRLVIHADIPGSLENYLQEAGRAGRDRDAAECILIFTEQDIESQFRLSSMSRLTRREIAQLLRGIRYGAKGEDLVMLTAGELLRMDMVEIDPDEHSDSDTRVRTAVSWLERAGYLERNENNTRVFQGKLLVKNMQEAVEKISRLGLSTRQRERWLAILSVFMEQGANQGVSADELASLSSFSPCEQDGDTLTEAQRVLRTLHDMAGQGLLSKETTLTAYVRYKVKKSSEKQLQRICALELDFLKVLGEMAPDVDIECPLELDLRQVNQKLIELGYEYSTPHSLKLILYGLSRDGKGLAGRKGSISVRARGNNRFTFLLHREWELMNRTVQIRQQAAHVTLQVMLGTIDPVTRRNANLLVEFTLEQIVDGLRRDLILLPLLKDPLAAAERALTFMHEQTVLDLQHGLAVFRQAMTITINPEAKGRRYSKADFSPLDTHYSERNFQIHVMNEYARQALEKLGTAMALVGSYFNDEKEDFVKRFFPGRKKFLERATSEQSYSRIVDDLKNSSQEKIVAAPTEKNMLILAGPGAGKTRVVTHRAAFLIRVKRVKAKAILILCFNRGAVMSLRQRLRDLVGNDMLGVTTLTFHGLALRLTGRSLVPVNGFSRNDIIDFSKVIQDAVRLLRGESDVIGFGDADPRDMLIGRFSHILVDEYQDIDEEQYELVSLLAGKTQKESDQKMTILAVGDDDQNIYRFRGANVGFIRRFHKDYDAQIHYLIENYRSTSNIIAAANTLISFNSDRMKSDYPIEVNQARQLLPPGGNWQLSDPITKGRVQQIEVADRQEQAGCLLEEMRRLQGLDNGFHPGNCAILAREWKDLDLVRSVFDEADVAVTLNWGRSSGFPGLTKIRENVVLLEYLREHRLEIKTADSLLDLLPENALDDNIWQTNLRRLIDEWREETTNIPQPVPLIEDYFYETFSDQGRSQNLGNGIFLSTVHSVKGLEFDHVFILGCSWKELLESEMEEERRLYYVAMSRARQTLHLFSLENGRNPHTEVLSGDYLMYRKGDSVSNDKIVEKRYRLLGMKDLFLDFAGVKKENHPVRRALTRLRTGDRLEPQIRNGNVELLNEDGISVARLSQAARVEWADRLDMIQEIRVVALVRRYRADILDTLFSTRCHGESWEVPVVEFIY